MKLAQPDGEVLLLQKRRRQTYAAQELKRFLQAACESEDDTITYEELTNALRNQKMIEFLELEGLSHTDILGFFAMMSRTAESFALDLESFANGCLRMKGLATSIDVQLLMFQVQELMSMQQMPMDGNEMSRRGTESP